MSSSPTDAASLVEVTMPQMGVSVAEGTIVRWCRAVGESILAEETICEISTDKIDIEVPSPASGVIAEILVAEEETVSVGTVIARLAVNGADATAGAAPPRPPSAPPVTPPAPPSGTPNGKVAPISPVVRRVAAEHGIDLAALSGTGRGGRIRKSDVLAALGGAGNGDRSSSDEPALHIDSPYRPDPPPADPALAGSQTERLSRMRRGIAEHMARSLRTAAHCTTWAETDMGRVEAARAAERLTALPYVAAATVAALRELPALNCWIDGETVTRHASVNLGIAVSLGEDGLIVPVVHRAEELSVAGLAGRIRELATRARAGALTPDDVTGATFTITNPGQFGSLMATPIINQPQVAILDLEAIVKRPVVVSGPDGVDAVTIRPMTILGLSWDHRALDGVLAAQFLAAVRRRLESWPVVAKAS